MYEYFPLLFVGGIVGVITLIFVLAYAMMKDKKQAIGFDRNMKDSELFLRLFEYAKPHWRSFLTVGLVMLFSIAYEILSPILIGAAEELVKDSFEISELLYIVFAYVGVLLFSLVSTYVQTMVLQRTGQKMLSAIREDVFTHIEGLSHSQLNHTPVGKLVTRVTNDTNAISMMFMNVLVNLVKNVFVIIGVLVAMLFINYYLTLMVLCFVPFIVIFTVIFRKFARRAYRKVKDGTTDINTYLSENLSGMKITQIFNREDKKTAEFSERNKRLARAKREQIFVFGIFRPMVYMLYISSTMLLLYLGAKGVIEDTEFMGQVITSGTLVTFYMFITKFFNPIQSLADQFNALQSAFASAEKIFTVLDTKPEIVDSPDAIVPESIRGDIEFKNVWFAYNEGEWVLRGVSFKVNAGDTVAFVGATGSGKTTILSLICRNYEVTRGEILIDGIDVKKYKISALRRHFGQMLQDVFLFSGTVRSNIVLRDESITDEQIKEVCDYVNATHVINKLPRGIDEEVRERGNNFSAGERQLISFARTVAHKPSVMILDEATANIDTETELLIQDSLEKMMNIGTMLVVAHRLSTVRKADKIIVLDHGEIIEEGSHRELIDRAGRYYELYTLQYNKEQLTGSDAQI